jgi:hypothetical protein
MVKITKKIDEEELVKEMQILLDSLSPEIRREAESIVKGERGLMPINSNQIKIVWVHPCGYGREAILTVDEDGRKQFERVYWFLKKQYNFMREKERDG